MSDFLNQHFAEPLGLLALLLVPILIIIYIIKHRTREVVVGSTYMWKRTLRNTRRKIPISIRNLLLIILQIASVILISMIIARPRIIASETGEVIIIIDGSSSMMAVDEDGISRMDRAKQKVTELAQDAGENSRVSVILAGDKSRVICRQAEARLDVISTLDKCVCDWGEADIVGALEDARKIQEENVNAKIIYYTDTTYASIDGVTTELVTDSEWNAAVLGIDVTRPAGAFAFSGNVVSYGQDAELKVLLYVDGEYIDSQSVVCMRGETVKVDFKGTYTAVSYERADIQIQLERGQEDAFSYDNTYSVFYTPESRPRVQLVYGPDQNDDFLESALYSSNTITQIVDIDSLTAEGYENRNNGLTKAKIKYTGFDLYIFVGVIPEEIPQDGTMWLMNPPTIDTGSEEKNLTFFKDRLGLDITLEGMRSHLTSSQFRDGFDLEPGISPTEPEFEILSGLSFLDTSGTNQNAVKVSSFYPITSNTYKPLLACDGDAVMMVGKGDRHARLIFSTILSSELAMRPENVLLISKLIEYAIPTLFESGDYAVGESAEIQVPAGINGIEVLRYYNEEDPITGDIVEKSELVKMYGSKKYSRDAGESEDVGDCTLTFEKPGNYIINMYISSVDLNGDPIPNGERVVTYETFVSLAESESDLYRTLSTSLTSVPPEDGVEYFASVEIWLELLIALLVVLTAEWWVYHHA